MIGTVSLGAIAALSAAGTWAARRYALSRRLMDEPGERRAHAVATPRGGGVGPVLGILLAVGLGWAWPTGLGIAGALALVAAIGAWDDHQPLPASRRLMVHVLAAGIVAALLCRPDVMPLRFAIAWFAGVALTNIWNFMDGIDGIAATQAVLVAATFRVLSGADVALAVAVACAAFLPFNFPRARIFMGDVGSGTIGLAVAALAVAAVPEMPSAADLTRVLLPLSAFLLDSGLTLGRRVLRRERWWEAHSQHLYQAFARRHGHPAVTLAYAAWTALAAVIAWRCPQPFIMPAGLAWYTAGAVLWFALQYPAASGRGDRTERDR